MDSRLETLDQRLKEFDSKLFACRNPETQALEIFSMMSYLEPYKREHGRHWLERVDYSLLHMAHVLSLTDTWRPDGVPVEWGWLNVWNQIRGMDEWANAEHLTKRMARSRESYENLKTRRRRNEIRAKALDMRRDFAKSTTDLNTAGMTGRTARES